MTISKFLRRTALTVAMVSAPAALWAQEQVIRAVTFTPANVMYAEHFAVFVERVNEAGEGVVRIDIIGGPETIPMQNMGEAQMNGIADMFNLPPGLYLDLIPEGEAFAGSNRTPMENRANGGLEFINTIFREKANAHVLAHVSAGAGFNIFLSREPSFDDDGNLDLDGYRIRSAPLYRAFFEALGATAVVMPAGEIYTSLERNVVDGTGYTIAGVRDFGWDRFLTHRIDPEFFQTDVLISMNHDAWAGLSDEAQAILNEVAEDFERYSFDLVAEETASEAAAMEEGGMQVIELTGDQREAYLDAAYTVTWERLRSRDATHYDALRELFFDEDL